MNDLFLAMRTRAFSTASATALALGACGGDGSSESAVAVAPGTVMAPATVMASSAASTSKVRNQPPTARVTLIGEGRTPAPHTFVFNGERSGDPDGEIKSYRWKFSDGSIQTGPEVRFRVREPGRYFVDLIVRDDAGATHTRRRMFTALEKRPDDGPRAEPRRPRSTADTVLATKADVVNFLQRSGLGGTMAEVEALVGTDAADWVAAEMAVASRAIYPATVKIRADGDKSRTVPSALLYDNLMGKNGAGALRSRMTFALSQIVVATSDGGQSHGLAHYVDILDRHAFGNYRDLLEDITFSPHMGQYLTYLGNRKADPETGREPDENYAREILQLFSIGVEELNLDGTPRLRGGRSVETYDTDDIVGLARVFTGLIFNRDTTGDVQFDQPMSVRESFHEDGEKSFLGTTIPAGTPAVESIELALDHIFAHPNVAPFISRQLIQRFTASSPSPAYVRRVAEVFEAGLFVAPGGQTFGTGQRGDLAATLAAVLLDRSLFDANVATTEGKLREPILQFASWGRTSGIRNIDSFSEWRLRGTESGAEFLIGQQALASPTVFNFYRPGYKAPGSLTAAKGLTAPELQILGAASRELTAKFMADFVWDRTAIRHNRVPLSYTASYPDLMPLASDTEALADAVALQYCGDRMSDSVRANMVDAVDLVAIKPDDPRSGKDVRVRTAVFFAVTAPCYILVK